jgi:hypothetical protein
MSAPSPPVVPEALPPSAVTLGPEAVKTVLAPPQNRRASRRMPPRSATTVTCRPNAMDVGPSLTVAVIDLSDTGAQLRLREPLKPGQTVTLTLGGSYVAKSVRRQAQVRWVSPPATDGTVLVGFAFDSPIRYADLTHFVRM